MARSSGTHLGEPRGADVAVKGERLADMEAVHEGETGGIDKGVQAFVVTTGPAPRLALRVVIDMTNSESRRLPHGTEELDGWLMAGASREEGPRLADNQRSGEQRTSSRLPDLSSS
jgi:hypothetical protein